jgi:histone deacetylase complex regulatory component SIN3
MEKCTTFVTQNKKSIRVEISQSEYESERNRIIKAMRKEDARLRKEERERNERGYCPECHILCTIDHVCMKCGKKISMDVIKAQAERRKKILELNRVSSTPKEKPQNVFYEQKKKQVEHVSSNGDVRPFYLKVYI